MKLHIIARFFESAVTKLSPFGCQLRADTDALCSLMTFSTLAVIEFQIMRLPSADPAHTYF